MAPADQVAIGKKKKFLIIWDFDRTIMDDDSDRWVVVEMGLNPLFNHLLQTLPWNSLMDRMMEELHSQGKTIEDIVNCLNRVPLHPQIVSAIKTAHAQGCDLKVLSDANQFFIETILKNHGVYDCFSEIITNPTVIDKEGRLRILTYHGSEVPPHGCDLCPTNLCKGLVVKQMQDSTSEDVKKQVIIYIGDGGGDFCPTLKLRIEDHVMPRKDFPLHNRILKSSVPIKPEVHEWSDVLVVPVLVVFCFMLSFLFFFTRTLCTCRRSRWKQSLYFRVYPGAGVGSVYILPPPYPASVGLGMLLLLLLLHEWSDGEELNKILLRLIDPLEA